MTTITQLSEQEYKELVFRDGNHVWELWDGVLVEKPPMSMRHDDVAAYLGNQLMNQLDLHDYRVNINGGKTRYTARNYLVPDVVVIPAALKLPFEDDPHAFNAFGAPLPFVAEVWSPSTGGYDVEAKLPVYRERGDLEIWYFHPFARTLTVWRRQPDGSYSEDQYAGGIVPVASFPGVSVNLDALP